MASLTGTLGEMAKSETESISVIIPTLNEENCIAAALDSLRGASDCEAIVVDGGSEDGTLSLARARGARAIVGRRGRAFQMNAGAYFSRGEILLFLHADTLLPVGFDRMVRRTLADGAFAGAFGLRLGGRGISMRVIETVANIRAKLFGLPYGDQALFLRAEDFFSMGGFKVLPIMEDVDFVRRVRKRGALALLPASVTSSSRRWKRMGVLRVTLTNQIALMGFLLGVSPERIAKFHNSQGHVG